MIANPRRELQIPVNINTVKDTIEKIGNYNKDYTLDSKNELLNQYKFSASEFLSLGVYILVDIIEVSTDQTKVSIEVERKLGTFDKGHELSNANEHLLQLVIVLA